MFIQKDYTINGLFCKFATQYHYQSGANWTCTPSSIDNDISLLYTLALTDMSQTASIQSACVFPSTEH